MGKQDSHMFFPSLKRGGYPGIVGCFWKVIDVNMLKTDRILFQGVHQIIFCTNIAFTVFS